MNMLSVLDYAVNVLKVKHVIVTGHYGCGGVMAAMSNREFGLIDNWLRHIKDVYRLHADELEAIADEHERTNRLVELNVVENVYNLCKTSIVQNAWKNGQELAVHGWVYSIATGKIKDMLVSTSNNAKLGDVFKFE
jgi:carbonic anhydrase